MYAFGKHLDGNVPSRLGILLPCLAPVVIHHIIWVVAWSEEKVLHLNVLNLWTNGLL